MYGEKWGNASCLTIDLENPRLRAAAAALAPAVLRLGGSPEDSVVFDTGGCVPGAPFEGFACSQTGSKTYGCLTPARWTALLQFAHDTGLQLVYGLNACYGRANGTAPMDVSNAEALMRYTATEVDPAVASALYGFELGNEISDKVDAAALGADVGRLAAVAQALWGNNHSKYPGPVFIAPDADHINATYFSGVAAAAHGNVSVLTYHQYVNCLPAAGFVLPPACLEKLRDPVAVLAPVAATAGAQLWSGEGAEHSGGGIAGLTDTFASSFFTAFKLGTLSSLGVATTVRQCLCGGDYELVDRHTFLPNPDFWLMWMWKTLTGVKAYRAEVQPGPAAAGLRAFATSGSDADGASVVVVVVNLATDTAFDVTLAGADVVGNQARWLLTGDVKGKAVSVNGEPPLALAGDAVPAFPKPADVKSNSVLHMPPASIAFVRVG